MTQSLARQYVHELLKNVGRANAKGLRILDFGAGNGTLMDAFAEQGAEVWGVEKYGQNHLEIAGKAAYRTLDEIPAGITFHGIISMDVVEHLPRPWDQFRTFLAKLEPAGWLLVSTPNPNGLNARITGSNWREAKKPGHILFLPERTIIKMLRDVGFSSALPVEWQIRYKDDPVHRFAQKILSASGLHGAVRVLAHK